MNLATVFYAYSYFATVFYAYSYSKPVSSTKIAVILNVDFNTFSFERNKG